RSYAADVDVASVGVAEVVSHGHELLRPLLRAALDPDGGSRRGKMVLERGFPTDSNPSRNPAPATACAALRRAPVTSSPRSRCDHLEVVQGGAVCVPDRTRRIVWHRRLPRGGEVKANSAKRKKSKFRCCRHSKPVIDTNSRWITIAHHSFGGMGFRKEIPDSIVPSG